MTIMGGFSWPVPLAGKFQRNVFLQPACTQTVVSQTNFGVAALLLQPYFQGLDEAYQQRVAQKFQICPYSLRADICLQGDLNFPRQFANARSLTCVSATQPEKFFQQPCCTTLRSRIRLPPLARGSYLPAAQGSTLLALRPPPLPGNNIGILALSNRTFAPFR